MKSEAKLRGFSELIADGWSNVLSGIGGSKDKSGPWKNRFNVSPLILKQELAALYESEGMISRIIDIVAEDMTRAGWTIDGDGDNLLSKKCENLHLASKLTQALKWMRCFGGGLIVLDIADNQTWDQPYNWQKGKFPVRALRTYSSARTVVTAEDYNSDPGSNWFEELEYFTIKRLYGPTFRVHSSRCVVLKGRPVPDAMEVQSYPVETRYWGLSIIQTLFQSSAAFGAFVAGIGHLGQEMTIGKYTISNLEELVADNDWKSLRARMRIIDESKSLVNAVLLGPNEKYERDSLSFAGVPEILDRLMQLVSAYSDGIPVSRLFGRSSAGLNSNGDGDGRDYYNMIENKQGAYLKGPLLQLLQAINVGEGYPVPQDELTVTFKPVWSPSQQEQVKMRLDVSTTDLNYIQMGVLQPDQIFQTRFKNGYSTEYQIEGDFTGPPEEDPEVTEALNKTGSKGPDLTGSQGGNTGNEPQNGKGGNEPGGPLTQPEKGGG